MDKESRSDLAIRWSSSGRQVRLNGSVASGARYLEELPVVCWSARDLRVIEGGPRDRRRFLDQGVVGRQPAAVEVLSRYRRALEQKRELLRQGVSGLEAWNELLAEAAAQLIRRRADFVAALVSALESTISQTKMDLPPVEVRYLPSPDVSEVSGNRLFEALESRAEREREERRVLVGPHLDKLEISWAGVEISRIASAGEKKLVGILLCAARGQVLSQVGRKPIVLLDDVDAELDRERLLAAWKLFESAPQIIATTCHTVVPDVLSEARVWRLDSGFIESP